MFQFNQLDQPTIILLLSDVIALALLFVGGRFLRKRSESEIDAAVVRSFNKHVIAWIVVCVVLALALIVNKVVTVIFFGLVSFYALREFITLTPTRPGDHRTLFWVILVLTPMQYVLVGLGWYEFYSIVIPVYGSLFIAARIAFAGDEERFLERSAKIQFGLLICVYAMSHAPALLTLDDLRTWDSETQSWMNWPGFKGGLLLYLVIIVQISELMHFVFDRTVGRHVIAPRVHSTRTWEGLLGAACVAAVVGVLIQIFLPVTPFQVIGSGCMALIIAVMGASGSMTIAAIKRDRGVKSDHGSLVQGHTGVLDRIASICFAVPIYFHVTRYFLERPIQDFDATQTGLPMQFWVSVVGLS